VGGPSRLSTVLKESAVAQAGFNLLICPESSWQEVVSFLSGKSVIVLYGLKGERIVAKVRSGLGVFSVMLNGE
jgi:hypothetical protein